MPACQKHQGATLGTKPSWAGGIRNSRDAEVVCCGRNVHFRTHALNKEIRACTHKFVMMSRFGGNATSS